MSTIRETAESLGVDRIRRHIFLCADASEAKCCPREVGIESWNFLKNA